MNDDIQDSSQDAAGLGKSLNLMYCVCEMQQVESICILKPLMRNAGWALPGVVKLALVNRREVSNFGLSQAVPVNQLCHIHFESISQSESQAHQAHSISMTYTSFCAAC